MRAVIGKVPRRRRRQHWAISWPFRNKAASRKEQRSFGSSSSSGGGDDEDEDTTVLLAISTHFDEVGRKDKVEARTTAGNNRIVARVIRRDEVEYERKKPTERRVDPDARLRTVLKSYCGGGGGGEQDGAAAAAAGPQQQQQQQTRVPGTGDSLRHGEDEEMLVMLEVDARLPSVRRPGIFYRLHMNMQ